MRLTHTISLVEVIWTLLSAIGCFYITKVFFRAVGDWVNLKLNRINSIREFSARVVVLTYGLYAFVELGFIVAGIIAMTQPVPMPYNAVSPFGLALTAIFLIIDFSLTACAFFIERWRQHLLGKISEIDDIDWYFKQRDKEEGIARP
jgi:hypothetical protein